MGMLSYIHNDFINLNLLEVFFFKVLKYVWFISSLISEVMFLW